jgi:methyl-accepting chemotaxis protein
MADSAKRYRGVCGSNPCIHRCSRDPTNQCADQRAGSYRGVASRRQVDEVLAIPRSVLNNLRSQHRYQAQLLLDSAVKQQDGESVEDVVRRRLPLADDHLRWEVSQIIFALKSQAKILQVGHEEVQRYQRDVANIHTFTPEAREALIDLTRRVEQSHERENDEMGAAIRSLNSFAQSIRQRISKAEARRDLIRGVIDRFFDS